MRFRTKLLPLLAKWQMWGHKSWSTSMIVCRVLCDSTHGSVGWSVGHVLLFSCVLRDSTPRYVGLLVGRLVSWSVSWCVGSLFYFLAFLSIRLLPRCPIDILQHCSCPPARDWASRVSGPALFSSLSLIFFSARVRFDVVLIDQVSAFTVDRKLIPQRRSSVPHKT